MQIGTIFTIPIAQHKEMRFSTPQGTQPTPSHLGEGDLAGRTHLSPRSTQNGQALSQEKAKCFHLNRGAKFSLGDVVERE